ncbi:MAG: hypothetical protein ACFFCS_26415 [Candidatus Hodarchaeota archaeon]
MNLRKNHKIVLFAIIMSFGLVNLVTPVSAVLEERPNITPKGNWYKFVEFTSSEPVDFIIKTEANVTIWFLGYQEFGTYLTNTTLPTEHDLNSIQHGVKKGDVYKIRQKWTVDFVNETYDIFKETAPGTNTFRVLFHIFIHNNEDTKNQVFIQLDPDYLIFEHLSIAAKIVVIILMGILVSRLFLGLKKAKKEGDEYRIKLYTGFGFGFAFGLASRLVFEIPHYYDRDVGLYLFPQDRLEGFISSLLFSSQVSTAIPTVLFLICLGGSFIGYSFIIERVVKDKKPFLSWNLVIATILVPTVLLIPQITDIILIYLLASAIIALINIMFVYGRVARNSKGIVKKNAIFIIIGITLPIIFQIIEGFPFLGEWSNSYFITRLVAYLFSIMGLTMVIRAVFGLPAPEKEPVIDESKIEIVKKLGFDFSRPPGITEQEITYHKEQKICLVCKSAVTRFNVYICPNCDALYCQMCARALSELENACWSCNAPFDPSRPVQLPEGETVFMDEVGMVGKGIDKGTGKKS